ncbi:MAG: hypothetical protein PHI27_12295 [Eubacteriales bacterium]|nr:hypothetical protein [Eubacteriales bacterium]MDD3883005.1 hypothetical protein [Eubacteriales bacterium]MDD4513887.1 hypothetical protein [Eubacteriales bacterium]
MTADSNLKGGGAWVYGPQMEYGTADCNGIIRSTLKSFYSRTAYLSILGKATTVALVVNALQTSEPMVIKDKESIPAGCIVISKDFSHMGITIGPYRHSTNAIIESAIRFNGVVVSQDWSIGEEPDEFYYYCYIDVVDYDTEIMHTGPVYFTIEDDEGGMVRE